MTPTAGRGRQCWIQQKKERNQNITGKMTFKQSKWCSMNLFKKKPTQLCIISDQLNEGQFLFYSIIFYTKTKSPFILQVFWTCYIKFFSFKQKIFLKSNKHQSISGLRIRAVTALDPSRKWGGFPGEAQLDNFENWRLAGESIWREI